MPAKLGVEGIVSERRDARYQHGRGRARLKFKTPTRPDAMRIEDGSF